MTERKPRARPSDKASSRKNSATTGTGTSIAGSRSSARNAAGHVYAVGTDGEVAEFRITRRTPKRVYFEVARSGEVVFEAYVGRKALERDGSAQHVWEGQASRIYATRATARKAAGKAGGRTPAGTGKQAEPKPTADLIPAGITVIMPPADSARNDSGGGSGDGAGDLWAELARGDWTYSVAAFATAAVARRIITDTPMTISAFAAESKRRNITGWQSQGSVSRRLRWADLHDECWLAGILPKGVFLSESATRPLFDGKLAKARRLELLGELFGPHLSDEQRRKLAAELSEALMREHLARQGDSGQECKAPRVLAPERVIARLLAQGMTAGAISEIARRLEDSARNSAERAG